MFTSFGKGLGKNHTNFRFSSRLIQCIVLPLLSVEECSQLYGIHWIKTTTTCTLSKGGESACNGDSGGPLVCEQYDLQSGIVSFGKNGVDYNDPSNPTVYTRVDGYAHFIESVILSASRHRIKNFNEMSAQFISVFLQVCFLIYFNC